jgi:2-methylisocitrate lyase-like PEP mutase family enzyme
MSPLRERLRQDRPLLAPGVYDALTAILAQEAGFEALYLSGGAVAYTQLGRADVGLTTASETANVLARITDRVQLPVIVDADTGYGNALNVQRTVRDFERAGAAMIQLEDQDFPKRCGHLAGKSLVGREKMCGKLRAALDARRSTDTLILARTDAIAVEGTEAAFERAEAYLECGADALFIEALRSREEMRAACERFGHRVPLLANMIEGGRTPVNSAAELGLLGFRIVIFPGGTAAGWRPGCSTTSPRCRLTAPRSRCAAKCWTSTNSTASSGRLTFLTALRPTQATAPRRDRS